MADESSTVAPVLRLGHVDPNSYAEPRAVLTKHVDLDWTIDFDRKTISGSATYIFAPVAGAVHHVLLDVDQIDVSSITHDGAELKFTISDYVKVHGSKLRIELPADGIAEEFKLTIAYETSPEASGLQWLTPKQTLGKKHPYVFSQCQAIQARSLLPCQDTPAVKFTYRSTVHHPEHLNALMSAVRLSSANGKTEYEQTVPICSYLLAIAVGDLVSRPLGPISNVWAEPAIVDAAAEEFSETETMLQTAIAICGEYVWKQYDLLVMPPSFPFGGMENPCLTFVTPTLIAGDKSLATVVAHEISHSWTGNLVTNANFEHFWLNEGFTMFLQGKITGRMYGAPARDFQAQQGLTELRDQLRHQLADTPALTRLVVDLSGPISPEDAFSRVPYMKGQTFLRFIEDTLGGPEVIDPFLKSYFDEYKYKSIDTDTFRQWLTAYFADTKAKQLDTIDWDLWLFGEGMPPVIPDYDNSLAAESHKHVVLWSKRSLQEIRSSELLRSVDSLTALQRIHALNELIAAPEIADLSAQWIELLEQTYGLGATATKNCELRCCFLRLCIRARLTERYDEIIEFTNSNFRMHYARKMYGDLALWTETKAKTVENYYAVRDQMMAVCAHQLAKDLGI